MTGLLVPWRMPSMPRGGVALEDRAVLGEGDLSRGVLRRLPVRVIGAALDVVDRLAIELERDAQLDQRLAPRAAAR